MCKLKKGMITDWKLLLKCILKDLGTIYMDIMHLNYSVNTALSRISFDHSQCTLGGS